MAGVRGSAARMIVIGGGVAGLSASWAARLLGFEVTCVEARSVGNPASSSAGRAKIFRYAYEDVRFAKFLAEVEPLWRELERRAGLTLVEPCPGLNMGPAGSPAVASVMSTLDAVDRPYEVLEPGDARLTAFGLGLRRGEVAVLEPGAGVMTPEAVLGALRRLVTGLGVTLRENTPVIGIEPAAGGLRVATAAAPLHADRVVIATGPWIGDLAGAPPLPLTVTRQHQLTLSTPQPIGDGARFSWVDLTRDDGYGITNHHGLHIVGNHAHGPAGRHSSTVREEVDLQPVRASLTQLRERLTGTPDLRVLDHRVCHYTNTGDGSFLVSVHPDLPEVVVLSACSGHGFKFALGTGRQAVQLALA